MREKSPEMRRRRKVLSPESEELLKNSDDCDSDNNFDHVIAGR